MALRVWFALALGVIIAVSAPASRAASPPQKQPAPAAKKPKPAANQITEAEIAEARRLLDHLGYWVVLEATGLDASLRHALTAFQKIEGRERTGVLTRAELEALRVVQRPEVLETGYPHVEIDLSRQVLFIIDSLGPIPRILPISSGSGELFTEGGVTRRAITPTGRFKIQRKIEGWRKSPLGLLYYPNYFYDGVAIHGNPAVPAYPASHGCIRIPMFAAKEFSAIATIGLVVIVYESDPLAETATPSQVKPSARGCN